MTPDRWTAFSRREQFLFIDSEFERARAWQGKDEALFKGALERALVLLDLTLKTPLDHTALCQILTLRAEIAKFYIGERVDSVAVLSHAL